MKEFEKIIVDISTPKGKKNAYNALKMFDRNVNDIHLQHNCIAYSAGFYSLDIPEGILALYHPKEVVIYPSAFKQMLARKFLKAGQLIVVKSECGKEFIIQFDSIVNNKIFRGYKSGEEFLFNIAGSFVRFANVSEWKEYNDIKSVNPYDLFQTKLRYGTFTPPAAHIVQALTDRQRKMLDEMLSVEITHSPFIGKICKQEDNKFAELKKAYSEGKVIQFRNIVYSKDWIDIKNPSWKVNPNISYRIKPQEKPKVGDVCKFWDVDENRFVISILQGFSPQRSTFPYKSCEDVFINAKPVTKQEVVELLFGKEQ